MKRKRKNSLYLLFLVVVVVCLLYVWRSLKVNNVRCFNKSSYCSKETESAAERYIGKSYFDARNLLSKELSESIRVKKYRISFNFPDILSLEVDEREPKVAAKFAENKYYVFDKEGVSLGAVFNTQLPVILVYEVPHNEQFSFGMKLANELVKYYDAGNLSVDKAGLYAKVSGFDFAFPLYGDIDVILGSLEVILSQLNDIFQNSTIMSTGKNHKVDLRYKNPVISM